MIKSILYPSIFVAIFLLLIQPTAHAQKHCDLSLHIFSPAYGVEIPFGDTVNMSISVKNLGPDDIDSSDAFWFVMENNPFNLYFHNFSIPAGDSLVYIPFSTLSGQQDTDYHLVLCTYIEVDSNTFVDDNPANDSACMDVVLKAKNPTSILPLFNQNLSVRLYPNPARDKVALLISLDQKEELFISVQNILGHTVQKEVLQAAKGKNEFPINIAGLASGIYFVKVVNANGQSLVKKLVVE